MGLHFEPIDMDRQARYQGIFSRSPLRASEYSFVNLWGWREEYGLEWAWQDELVWIRQRHPETRYWAPVGPWESIHWQERFAGLIPENTLFVRIPEQLAEHWQAALDIAPQESRNDWDYLYSVQELIELRGNRFHKKKNLLNQFNKKYKARYQPITSEMMAEVLKTQETWCEWRDCESVEILAAENRVIDRVLRSWDDLEGLMGGAFVDQGRIIAFTVGEALRSDTLLVHFEKGLSEYKGIYQAINQYFLAHHPEYEWVNREQDLGDPGLRKAKSSYNPVDFVKKYSLRYP